MKPQSKPLRFVTLLAVLILLGNLTLGPLVLASGTISRTKGKKAPSKSTQAGQLQGQSQISPEGMRQMAALEAEKLSRTPAERKIASHLLQGVREARGEEMTPGVNVEKAKIKLIDGRVAVDITATVTNDLLSRIEQLGGSIIFPSVQFKSIRAMVPLSAVETIAGYSEVMFIRTAARSRNHGLHLDSGEMGTSENGTYEPVGPVGLSQPGAAAAMIPTASAPRATTFAERAANVRSYISKMLPALAGGGAGVLPYDPLPGEGVIAMQGNLAIAQYGFQGEGVKIGVLSDSYNFRGAAAANVLAGALPGPGNPYGYTTPVTVVQDLPINSLETGTDEGRAILECVHAMAPAAQLFFATADISEAGFAENIETLRNLGCNIVLDDVGYFDEGVFYDSIVAQAVNYVTNSGGYYFSAAGNDGNFASSTSGTWEGDFMDAGSPALPVLSPFEPGGGTIMNWGTVGSPIASNVITQGGGDDAYTLDWPPDTVSSEGIGLATNDYDLFVLNKAGAVKTFSTDEQDSMNPAQPHEEIDEPSFATGDQIVIFKTAAAAYRAMSLDTDSDSETIGNRLTFVTGDATRGHPCAAGAFGVAAVGALEPVTNTVNGLFTTTSQVETFSSDGPRRVFYNSDGTPVSAGNLTFASNGFTSRQKPDVSGADFVSTSTDFTNGLNPFAGTSCATEHAAGVAALLLSANPTLTPTQVRAILTNTANTINIDNTGTVASGFGPLPNRTVGYGILDALSIVGAGIATAGSGGDMANIALGTVTVAEGTFSNHNTLIEPGENANITVQLTNPSMVSATNVVASLVSLTPGVTVATGSPFNAGTIAAAGSATNATPFVVGISSSLACNTAVSMEVNVTLTGGIPVSLPFNFTLGDLAHELNGAQASIFGTIGTTPVSGSGYTATGGTKTGTFSRDAIQATCAVPKTATQATTGTGFSATVGGRYAAYTFTNPLSVSTCIDVTVTSDSANSLETAAFTSAGFVPTGSTASLAHGTNYLADPGTRAATMSYSFTVAANTAFTVVVYDATTTGNAAPYVSYTLSVIEGTCQTPGGTCTTISITPATTIASGVTNVPYSQTFTVSGGSGNSVLSISGTLPAGLSLTGKVLSGTPTQAGTFPIMVTAIDDAGCPSPTNSYSLVINGTLPASVMASAGSGQTALVGAAFTTDLQATVFDGGAHPLSGVNVVFTAPSTGASGTFTGGLTTVTVATVGGVATAPTFTANTTSGGYSITAAVVGIATPATFGLNNTCPGSFVVTTNADSGSGSLRAIIANACNGAQVTFAPNVTGTITLTSGELDIEKSITITGPGANVLAINGNSLERVFAIGLSGVSNTVIISGLTITGGVTPVTELFGGGGVFVNTGTVNLTDDVISNNDCSNSGFAFGGGVDTEGGDLTITRCLITGNTTNFFGGGVWAEATSTLITETTITGNSAGPTGGGGGLAVAKNTAMFDSTVYANSANGGGNIIAIEDLVANPILSFGNSIVAGGILVGSGAAGADLLNDGGSFTSLNYDLIQDTTNDASPPAAIPIGGTTTNNITGVSPNLLALANYGGPSQSLLPAPNSPVINKGNPTPTATLDQRAFPRVEGGTEDIGAIETNYSLSASGGGGQSTPPNTKFTSPLKATVTESGNDIAGATVTFTPPATGPSCAFVSNTAVTISGGLATSTALTANGTSGGPYNVIASIGTAIPTVTYALTNSTCAAITVGPSTIPTGTVGSAFTSTQFTQTGGTGTVTFSETGSLPTGMTFTTAGVLSGTPGVTGSFPITVTATDAHNCIGSKSYTININCSSITVGPSTIPAAVEHEAYSEQFTHTGGVGTVTFSTTSTLPAGITLSSAGLLSGTPTSSGTFPIAVKATDSKGCSATETVSLSVTLLNMCLHDDHTGDFIQFNSTTGAYIFTLCGTGGFNLSGTGTVTTAGGILTITDKESTKSVTISYNTGSLTGTATVTMVMAAGVSQTYRISDTNPHPVCSCATP